MKKNKSSSGNPKKNKSRKNNNGGGNNKNSNKVKKAPISLDEVLEQAESAMEMFDFDGALKLFTYAKEVLTSQVHAPASINGSGGNSNVAHGNDHDRVTLATVLGKMGEIQSSNGDSDGARKHFLDAIELMGPTTTEEEGQGSIINIAQNCEKRAGLHLYLGQLSSGIEALNYFRVGVSELERSLSVFEGKCAAGTAVDLGHCDDVDPVNLQQYLVETRRQLCAVFCSIAELYLTDLCEEPDAESLCEAAVNSALALDEASSATISSERGNGNDPAAMPQPDALQTIANFRLSQCRVPEAAVCILKAYERMKVGCEAMSALVGLADTDGDAKGEVEMEAKSRELVDVEAADSLPEYSFRCQTAKIMLECASLLDNAANDTKNQCAESAIQVLGSLLAENDEVIEVWYLLGCAFMACTPSNDDSAHYYWESALSMLLKVKEDLEKSLEVEEDANDEYELEVVESQIIEVKKKLGTYSDEDSEHEEDDADMMQD